MRSTRPWLFSILALAALLSAGACSVTTVAGSSGSSGTTSDAGGGEGDTEPAAEDAGGGSADGGSDSSSPGTEASAPTGDILGTLASGQCGGVLKPELTKPSPSFVNNALVFVSGETYDKASLSPGGQILFDTPNAGGSSTESETMSFEIVRYCDGAKLLKTETQIKYQPPDNTAANTISDILVEIDGKKVGISVVRVYKPSGQPAMTDDAVKALLEKKLVGIIRSSERVLPEDKWVKQIMHVFTVNAAGTAAVARVWPTIAAATRADTITLVTQTTGGGFLYCDPDPALGSECPP